jgi:hypothetical protein
VDHSSPPDELAATPIERLNLAVPTFNLLKRNNINTIGDLFARSAADVAGLRRWSLKNQQDLEQRLLEAGVSPQLVDHWRGAPPSPPVPAYAATPIEELNLSVRTYVVLKRRSVHTIGDLLAQPAAELLQSRDWPSFGHEEVRQRLLDAGIEESAVDGWRHTPIGAPVPPDTDPAGGRLLVRAGKDDVTAAVRRCYAAAGLTEEPFDPDQPYRADDVLEAAIHAETEVAAETLGPDCLLILPARTGSGYVSVLSERYARTPPGRNPLAAALSAELGRTVYGFLQVSGIAELTAYESGRAVRTLLNGGAANSGRPALALTELSGAPMVNEVTDLNYLTGNLPLLVRLLGFENLSMTRMEHYDYPATVTFRARST